MVDYLCRRKQPLMIDVWKGDVALPHECAIHADAVICIELCVSYPNTIFVQSSHQFPCFLLSASSICSLKLKSMFPTTSSVASNRNWPLSPHPTPTLTYCSVHRSIPMVSGMMTTNSNGIACNFKIGTYTKTSQISNHARTFDYTSALQGMERMSALSRVQGVYLWCWRRPRRS